MDWSAGARRSCRVRMGGTSIRAGTARQLLGAIKQIRGRILNCLSFSSLIGEVRIRMTLLKLRACSRNTRLAMMGTNTDLVHPLGWQNMDSFSIWILMMNGGGWHLLWKTIRQYSLSSDSAFLHFRLVARHNSFPRDTKSIVRYSWERIHAWIE